MKAILAKYAGFCEGVERAYRIAISAVKNKPVHILGDLVHNKDVTNNLKALGIKKVRTLKDVPAGGTVIFTAHGVSPRTVLQAKKKHLKIVDTTCPWVSRAQNIAERLSKGGRQVIIVGDKGHPEVKGLVSWAGKGAIVIERPEDLKGTRLKNKVGLIAQTTQSEENFKDIEKLLKGYVCDLEVHNTICDATAKRQCFARDLSNKADLMLVVGDRKSANTKRLLELCLKSSSEAHQIERAGDLKGYWLKGKQRVGVTAGASTPAATIKLVLKKIRTYAKAS